MEITKEMTSHYLSRAHYKGGRYLAPLILFACFVLSQFYWQSPVGSPLLAKGKYVFGEDQWWRLLSSTFIHGDLHHLLSNSLMLTLMAYFVTNFYGPKVTVFLVIFFGAAVNALTLMTMKASVGLLGASGVVYLLWGFWLSLYLAIDIKHSLNRRLMKVVAVTLMVLIPTSVEPNVSYMAHFNGFWLGAVSGVIYYLIHRKHIRSYDEYHLHVEPEIPPEERWWQEPQENEAYPENKDS